MIGGVWQCSGASSLHCTPYCTSVAQLMHNYSTISEDCTSITRKIKAQLLHNYYVKLRNGCAIDVQESCSGFAKRVQDVECKTTGENHCTCITQLLHNHFLHSTRFPAVIDERPKSPIEKRKRNLIFFSPISRRERET